MVQEEAGVELLVHEVEQEDAGDYTCDVGHMQSTARLTVRGELLVALSCPAPSYPMARGRGLFPAGKGCCGSKHPFLAFQPPNPSSKLD
jgi:hypothetical protein